MSIERKTLPYEIMIRFNGGAAHQIGSLGDFCGAHFIEAETVVDTDSGEVLSYKPGEAKALPDDMIGKYLTEQFGQVHAGFTAMELERDEARSELKRIVDAYAQNSKDVTAQIESLQRKIAELEKMRTDVVAAAGSILQLASAS
jgi:hypothetical protein